MVRIGLNTSNNIEKNSSWSKRLFLLGIFVNVRTNEVAWSRLVVPVIASWMGDGCL
jgi:hypothetical protein